MQSVTVIDYTRVVIRSWLWVLVVTLVAGGVAAVYGAMQPRVYRTTATVLAPRESAGSSMSSSLGALLASAGGGGGSGAAGSFLPGIMMSLPSTTTTLDVLVAVLRSRTLREEVLQGLQQASGVDVAARFLGAEPSAKEKSIVSVTVDATDPKVAADVANAYFDYLDRRLQRSAEAAAKRQEMLYVAQLERAAREVDAAEHELLKFQTENRMLASTDQATKGQVEGGAMLRGQIMALELQREVLRMRFTDQHPEMREIEKRIAELKKQYSRNLFGAAMDLPPESPGAKGSRKEFFVAAERITPVQFAYLKLVRNLRIQEAFYIGAVQGLQQIQYTDGANRPPEIERLDPALPSSRAVRPNHVFILSVGVGIGLVVAVCGVLARQAIVIAMASHGHVLSSVTSPPERRRRVGANGDIGAPAAETAPSPGSLV